MLKCFRIPGEASAFLLMAGYERGTGRRGVYNVNKEAGVEAVERGGGRKRQDIVKNQDIFNSLISNL